MADEPDDDDLDEIEAEGESPAEWVDCEKGSLCFPHGTAWYADIHGFNRIFIDFKTGDVMGEDNETGLMRKPTRKGASVQAIKAQPNDAD